MGKFNCKYCNAKGITQNICSECYQKLKRIRKLKEILNRIQRIESEAND